jgi:hypothetical protein
MPIDHFNGPLPVRLPSERKASLTDNGVFSKTLFTPAGIDIYLRTTPGKAGTGQGSRRAVLETIITKLGEIPNENVRSIARDGFEVPGVV